MSQGKLNAIPPGAGGIAGKINTAGIGQDIAKQGQAPSEQPPQLGSLPGAFGQPGGSIAQPRLDLFGGFGVASPAVLPGLGPGTAQTLPAKQLDPNGMSGILGRYNAGPVSPTVNQPAAEDELDGLGGPDTVGSEPLGGY